MIRAAIAAAAVATAGVHPPPAPVPAPTATPVPAPTAAPTAAPAPAPSSVPDQAAAPARVPGFAAALAEQPLAAGPAAWHAVSDDAAWSAIAAARPGTRQAARWAYATSLIASGRGSDALGVLDVMIADDPDLDLVPAWRRARGASLTQLGRTTAALAALDEASLIDDAESCLWRMRALADAGQSAAALGQLRCAMPAINARGGAARRPFVIAAGQAAVATGRYRPALDWLAALPDGDAAANLLRGRAALGIGVGRQGRLRLERVLIAGTAEQRADAALSLIEGGVASHALKPGDALKRLDVLRFAWRGGAIETRMLRLALRLAIEAHDTAGALAAGAVLFRYHDLGADTAPLVATLQAQLVAALSPGADTPLDRSAGLFWDYRDLMPTGIDGDRLVETLVERLQGAGLYARAADLLTHRLTATAQGIEQGPLSVRIASLHILAGVPDRAVRVLRATDAAPYPAAMQADRRRIEAAALELLGKPVEALAAIQDIPDAAGLRAEIYWRARDWTHLVESGAPALPRTDALSEVAQAIVLRHAIGLAMLGRDDALKRLNARYARAFANLPTAACFAMLSTGTGPIDPSALGKAMATLPSTSPAGEIGDLIEAGSAAMTRPAA